jgi:hypothetical protein
MVCESTLQASFNPRLPKLSTRIAVAGCWPELLAIEDRPPLTQYDLCMLRIIYAKRWPELLIFLITRLLPWGKPSILR